MQRFRSKAALAPGRSSCQSQTSKKPKDYGAGIGGETQGAAERFYGESQDAIHTPIGFLL